eukprot:217333-Hanusia_phi.AAC.1
MHVRTVGALPPQDINLLHMCELRQGREQLVVRLSQSSRGHAGVTGRCRVRDIRSRSLRCSAVYTSPQSSASYPRCPLSRHFRSLY